MDRPDLRDETAETPPMRRRTKPPWFRSGATIINEIGVCGVGATRGGIGTLYPRFLLLCIFLGSEFFPIFQLLLSKHKL